MITRRESKQVMVGSVPIGGGAPIAIQTMYDEPLPAIQDSKGYENLLKRLRLYAQMGCHIIRFSYPSLQDHLTLYQLVKDSPLPIVADIHFDWKLAIDAIACNVAKLRINPGNIGAKWKVQEIVEAAKDHQVAIRIGLNGGSLPHALRSHDHSEAMVSTALTYINWFESWNFTNIVLSLKDTNEEITYRANSDIAPLIPYPLHLGVTEAGGIISAVARSTWVLGRLLSVGIGDTIRISITEERTHEIIAAKEILRTVGVQDEGIRIISCPRCGRASFDSQQFLHDVESDLSMIRKNICVAIMGCQVNGPGEASHADIAITGIGNRVFLYKKGVLYKEITSASAKKELLKAIEEYEGAQ